MGARPIPELALRRLRPILKVNVGFLVGRDHAGARPALDRHVADRHAAFHRKRLDRRAAVFDDMAGAARRTDLADDRKDYVLGGDPGAERPVDDDAHVLGLGLDQGLRRQHMLDFRGADAMGERAERAVRRGVAVAAHDRRARQRGALLRPDDVYDDLAMVDLVVVFDADLARVLRELLDLQPALGIGDAAAAVGRLDVVIDDGERLFGRPYLAAAEAEALERLWARHLMHEMSVDVDQAGAARRLDDVVVPDFVVHRARLGHGSLRRVSFARTGNGEARYVCRTRRREKGARRRRLGAIGVGSTKGSGATRTRLAIS